MTTHHIFWQAPDQLTQKMPKDHAGLPVLDPPGILRSASDSLVNSKGRPALNLQHADGWKSSIKDHDKPRDDVTVQTIAQGTLVIAARASSPSNARPTSRTASFGSQAAKQQKLQLPSFHALGIANPYPNSILTPPDEHLSLNWTSSGLSRAQNTPTPSRPLHSKVCLSNTPESPLPDITIHGASSDNTTQAPVGALISPSISRGDEPGSDSSNSSTATEVPSNMPWLDQALGAVCKPSPYFRAMIWPMTKRCSASHTIGKQCHRRGPHTVPRSTPSTPPKSPRRSFSIDRHHQRPSDEF